MSESKAASVVFTNSSYLAGQAQTTAEKAQSAAGNAYKLANDAQKTADGKNSIYRGTDTNTVPTAGLKEGDLYFTDNALYTWNGSAWEETVSDTTGAEIKAQVEKAIDEAKKLAIEAQTTADGKNSVYRGSDPNTVPTARLKEGDLYFTNNAVYTWTGSAWEKTVSDTTGAEINARVDEAIAKAKSAEETADSKNKVYRVEDVSVIPTANLKTGDICFTDNAVYTWTGSAWEETVSDTTGAEIKAKVDQVAQESQKAVADLTSNVESKAKELDASIESTKTSLTATTNQIASDLSETKSSMQSGLDAVNKDLSTTKSDLATVSKDLTTTKSDLADTGQRLETAVSDFQKKTDQLSGSLETANSKIEFNSNAISEVKHTAEEISTTVSNLHAGDRNYVRGTSNNWKDLTNFNNTANVCLPLGTFYPGDLKGSDQITLGLTLKNVGITSGTMWLFQGYGDVSGWRFGGASDAYDIAKLVPAGQTAEIRIVKTLSASDVSNNTIQLRIRTDNVPAGGTLSVKCVYIKRGTLATDWSPAPEDTDQAISKVSQTADAIRADLTNMKGDVASVKATANSLTSDMKDAKGNISSLQQDTNGLTTRVGNAEGNISQLQLTANGLNAYIKGSKGSDTLASLLSMDPNNSTIAQVVNGKPIAAINMSSEGDVTIDGKKLHITASTTIDDASIGSAKIASLSADKITTGTLDASVVTVKNINADNISTGTLAAEHLHVTKDTVIDNGVIGNAQISNLNADKITAGTLDASQIRVINLDANSITTGSLSAAVIRASGFNNYTVSPSNTWNFDDTKSAYGNWFLTGETTADHVYNGPKDANNNKLTPFMYVTSRGNPDGNRFTVTVWKDNDPTQYQRTWDGNHWSDWVILPNSQNIVSAINLSPDSVMIAGKKIMLDGDVAINGTAFASKLKATGVTVDQLVAGKIDASKIDVINLNANNITTGTLNGITINGSTFNGGKFVSSSYNTTVNNTIFDSYKVLLDGNGLEIDSVEKGNGQTALLASRELYLGSTNTGNRYIHAMTAEFIGNPTIFINNGSDSTVLSSDGITSNSVHAGNFMLTGHKMRATDNNSLYVTNSAGNNFDGTGNVGFQVWNGIGLGASTIYTPGTDLYVQQGNVGPAFNQSYSSAAKTEIHCKTVTTQVANTVTSQLSVKTAITKVDYDRALMAIQNTDMYDYRYISDDSDQHYVSGIIDDVHASPEYKMDDMLINKERTARIDANLLGYHHVVLQKLLERVDALEHQINKASAIG